MSPCYAGAFSQRLAWSHHRLRQAVSDRRYPQHPDATIRFEDPNLPHQEAYS